MERAFSAYSAGQDGKAEYTLDDVLKLLGATYGWMMIHIAMDDMAIVGKGAMSLPEERELSAGNITKEMDAMLKSLLQFDARTKIVDSEFKGDSMSSAVCQKITYDISGTSVTLVVGLERSLLRCATEAFWGQKVQKQKIDKAHMELLQWCLTAFSVSLWRELIVRFAHDKSCLLKDTSPLEARRVCQLVRSVHPRQSTLYETSKGRFFVISDCDCEISA
jgi:hypothetical protein